MPLTATMKRTSTLTTYCAYFLVVSSFASAMGIELEKRDDGSSQKRLDIPVQYGSSGQYAMAVNMVRPFFLYFYFQIVNISCVQATGPNIQDFNFTFTLGSGLTYAAGTSCQTCTGIGL